MAQTLSEPLPTTYRTFSRRQAPSLTIAGGVFAVVGGLGVVVRALEVTPAGTPQRIASITGFDHVWGWIIASLGILAVAAGTQWNEKMLARASAPIAVSAAAVTMIALRLDWAGDVAGKLAFGAGTRAGSAFTTYHAGFGWGAWLLAIAAVSLVLGAVAGVLRAIDVRKGIES